MENHESTPHSRPLALQSNLRQRVQSSARRFVRLIDVDAPDTILEFELRMLAERSARLLAELREKRISTN